MNCSCFEDTLYYSPPSHGDWGIVRVAALVPESHLLFVSPSACGRHGALGALQHGFKDRVSYLAIDQQDIIAGYDGLIEQAVAALLDRRRPKAVIIYVSCLDDLIGTDLDSLCHRLRAMHPGVAFQPAHMNPIALDSKKPPMLTTQQAMYNFLNPRDDRDGGVNLIGNLEPLDPDCELFPVLNAMGASPARHLSDYATFEAFQQMAQSRANLVLSPIAALAAQTLARNHGMPFLMLPVSYDLREIDGQYASLAAFLDAPLPDLSGAHQRAAEAMDAAQKALNGRPVWIAGGAVMRPFGLARALLSAGFRVETVVAQMAVPVDRDAFEWLHEAHPEINVIQPQHARLIDFDHPSPEAVAIGFDAAYIAGTSRVVPVTNDDGMFGYGGVVRLMRRMIDAAAHPADLRQMIDDYGVVL